MDLKKYAVGFKAPYLVTHRVLPALGLSALEPAAPSKKVDQADPPSEPTTAATEAPEPAAAREPAPARPPHLMRVELRNGNGVPGQAGR